MFGLRLIWILTTGIVLSLFSAGMSLSIADIYYYTDKNGVRHFSNMRQNNHYRLFLRSSAKEPPKSLEKDGKQYEDIILLASRQYQVDHSLIKAVIKAESDFNHRAVSRKGAQGLMQLMPGTADQLNVIDPFDPKENVLGGTRYLSLLLKRFNNDKKLALAAYNAGPEEVESRQGIPPFPETMTFVQRVMNYYYSYNNVE